MECKLNDLNISSIVWFGIVWFGIVWFGIVWFVIVWFGIVWHRRFLANLIGIGDR